MKVYLILFVALLTPCSSFAADTPEPYPANNQLYFTNDGVNENYSGKLISLEGQILRIEPGPQSKPMYQIRLPVPLLKNVWVASLMVHKKAEYEAGQIIRAMGYLQPVANDDKWTQSVTKDRFHILGFCFLNVTTLKGTYLPAGVKQCEGWQSGKQPSELM